MRRSLDAKGQVVSSGVRAADSAQTARRKAVLRHANTHQLISFLGLAC